MKAEEIFQYQQVPFSAVILKNKGDLIFVFTDRTRDIPTELRLEFPEEIRNGVHKEKVISLFPKFTQHVLDAYQTRGNGKERFRSERFGDISGFLNEAESEYKRTS